jgi:cellulose synthase/poly-beta-1,6-N-acetylglucosamine synthase-like glycosyltransferase
MYKKFFSSVTFLISSLAVLIQLIVMLNTSDTLFFGLDPDNLWSKLVLFDPARPLKSYGLTWLSSLFYSIHSIFFIIVLMIFWFLAQNLERQFQRKGLLLFIIASHVLILSLLYFNYLVVKPAQAPVYAGLSYSTVSLLALSLMHKRRWNWTGLIWGVAASYAYIEHASLIDPHLYAVVVGSVFGYLLSRKSNLRR